MNRICYLIATLALAVLLAGCAASAESRPDGLETPPPGLPSIEEFAASMGIDPDGGGELPPMSPALLLIAVRYDLNGNNMIEKPEVVAAINDYLFNGSITKADVVAIINLYLFGGLINPNPTPGAGPAQLSGVIAKVRPAVVKVLSSTGQGSGVIFASNVEIEGQLYAYVVTNQHVVGYDTDVTVVVGDNRNMAGYVLGADEAQDLAVVRIPCGGECAAVGFGNSTELSVGDGVVAIGYPLDYYQPAVVIRPTRTIVEGAASVTQGIVSAFRYDSIGDRDLVQTDTPINPGNSGGPLLNMNGEIVGINTFGLRDAENLNYAVLETTVQNRLPALVSGELPRPTPGRPAETRLVTISGPVAGHIHHNPDDGRYDSFPSHLSIKNVVAGAWFQNPYEGTNNQPFSYGFRIRLSGSVEPFLVFYVRSDRSWSVESRLGRDSLDVAGGNAPGLRTGAGEWNYVSALTVDNAGALFINGEWVQLPAGGEIFDLGPGTASGSVDIINGYVAGTERAGAITHFESFTGKVLEASSVSSTPGLQQLMAQVEADYHAGPAPGIDPESGHADGNGQQDGH